MAGQSGQKINIQFTDRKILVVSSHMYLVTLNQETLTPAPRLELEVEVVVAKAQIG